MDFKNIKRTILIGLLLLLPWGCSSTPPLLPEQELKESRDTQTLSTENDEKLWGGEGLSHDPKQVAQARMRTMSSYHENYLVGAGDIIEIIYNFRYELTPEEYILEIQDDLNIQLLFNSAISRNVRIRMDGKITLPLIGEIAVANKSTREVQQEISEKYSHYIKDPVVTVEVQKGNVKIQELKKAITTAARGQSKLIPVRPDGMITLPLIGDVQASGLTIPEIRYEINRRYSVIVRNLDTTVILKKIISNQIYVLGEVYRPGVFTTPYPVTSIQAIAMAGGLKNDANEDSIVVLRDVGLPVPKGIRIDLGQLFSMEKSSLSEEWEVRRKKLELKLSKEGITDIAQIRAAYSDLGDWTFIHNDVALRRNDIVYVPKSFIGSVDKFIDQWFTRGVYSAFPADSTMDFILDTWDVIHIDERRTYSINENDNIIVGE